MLARPSMPRLPHAPTTQSAGRLHITWLVADDGKKLPHQATSRRGQPKAEIVDGSLRIEDDSDQEEGCFWANWKADAALEIVVEARAKMGGIKGWRGGQLVWPWRDGTPAGLLVSNGKHHDGIVLSPARIHTLPVQNPLRTRRARSRAFWSLLLARNGCYASVCGESPRPNRDCTRSCSSPTRTPNATLLELARSRVLLTRIAFFRSRGKLSGGLTARDSSLAVLRRSPESLGAPFALASRVQKCRLLSTRA
jgi:hypothetical protein